MCIRLCSVAIECDVEAPEDIMDAYRLLRANLPDTVRVEILRELPANSALKRFFAGDMVGATNQRVYKPNYASHPSHTTRLLLDNVPVSALTLISSKIMNSKNAAKDLVQFFEHIYNMSQIPRV